MAASVQFRPHNRDLGMVMREVDEEIAIFLGMRNAEKQTNDPLLVDNFHEYDDSIGAESIPNNMLTSNDPQIDQIAADYNFLKLESDKSDFDWLLTQADTSLLPASEIGVVQDSEATQIDATNGENISLESELPCDQFSAIINSSPQLAKSIKVESSASKQPSSSSGSRKPTSRAATPTRLRSLPAKPKPFRASTPTSRTTTIPSSKATTAQARSSTPSTRASLPTTSSSKRRSSTPTTRKPTTPSGQSSSMMRKTGTTVLKTPVVKSRPSKPLESLSLSQDAAQNLKAVMPKRPASASRGRPSAPATNPSLLNNGKPRQKSCSPARVRVPNGLAHNSGSKSRGHNTGGGYGDDVNPVLMGTQMVDRVVNMRKLAPPKLDECLSHDNGKKSSKASGFGRSLSSRSLEMAVRHMGIRRSIADGIRPVATGASASFSFGTQSCSAKSGTLGASESPVASSSDGSESFNSHFGNENEIDGGLNMKC